MNSVAYSASAGRENCSRTRKKNTTKAPREMRAKFNIRRRVDVAVVADDETSYGILIVSSMEK